MSIKKKVDYCIGVPSSQNSIPSSTQIKNFKTRQGDIMLPRFCVFCFEKTKPVSQSGKRQFE